MNVRSATAFQASSAGKVFRVAEVETTRDGSVLTVTLNRPDVLNAFDSAMHDAFGAAIQEAADPDVRAVVLTGAGRGFCVGQDLNAFKDGGTDVAELLRTTFNPNVVALRTLEKPVIAAVNGAAAGAGVALACACDIRLAASSAVFVPAFVNVGLVPDTGATYFVSRLLGYSRAFEWLCSGRRLSAADAHAWDLVSEVVDDGRLEARTAEVASMLAALPTRAIGMTKRLLEHAPLSTLEDQLELEAELQAAAATTEDFREGVDAFLAKREPRFSGR
jgi:2-(1,2-epoxy-1,2-dihydrophenyl)acetyl-CoA isomerase